jgi:hypothetical protein
VDAYLGLDIVELARRSLSATGDKYLPSRGRAQQAFIAYGLPKKST